MEQQYRIADGVHARRFDTDLVILDLRRGEYFSLNDVGAEIWTALCAGRSSDEIARELCATYDVAHEVAEEDVRNLVSELVRRGLIIPTSTSPAR